MLQLAERQGAIAAALLDPALPVPLGLLGPAGEPSPRRFAVYCNNVVASLSSVLATAFPAACRIAGEEFFQTMARKYVRSAPPSLHSLFFAFARWPGQC